MFIYKRRELWQRAFHLPLVQLRVGKDWGEKGGPHRHLAGDEMILIFVIIASQRSVCAPSPLCLCLLYLISNINITFQILLRS